MRSPEFHRTGRRKKRLPSVARSMQSIRVSVSRKPSCTQAGSLFNRPSREARPATKVAPAKKESHMGNMMERGGQNFRDRGKKEVESITSMKGKKGGTIFQHNFKSNSESPMLSHQPETHVFG